MKDDFEEILKKYKNSPGPQVKTAVLGKFIRDAGNRASNRAPFGFWRRPVPLYSAAAILVVLAGLSFYAGRATSARRSPANHQGGRENLLQTNNKPPVYELAWESAAADMLWLHLIKRT